MPHNVFISWSGHDSKALATELHQWLPTVINAVEPFMSEADIEAGTRWSDEIADKLRTIKTGIVCLTSKNQSSGWLNFEAGALSRAVDDPSTRVIVLPLDMEKAQIRPPLSSFQAKLLVRADVFGVCASINNALEGPVDERLLQRTFNQAWPTLEAEIQRIKGNYHDDSDGVLRSQEDMLEELVVAVREQSKSIALLGKDGASPTIFDTQRSLAMMVLKDIENNNFLAPKDLTLGYLEKMAKESELDSNHWNMLRSAPFLYWYITEYKGIPSPVAQATKITEMDDVPF